MSPSQARAASSIWKGSIIQPPYRLWCSSGFLVGASIICDTHKRFASMLLHSSISMYADDTVIYYSGSEVSNIRENLQEDLNCVQQWLVNTKLILNQSKTKGFWNKTTAANHLRLCPADSKQRHRESDEVHVPWDCAR